MLLATHPVRLPVFEGPLDLLLQLIERQEMDITAVSLAQVTDQYLAVIEELGQKGMADLTAFLVVAARLVLIKSRVLLPGYRPTDDEADEVAIDLVQQLEAYRRFKTVAQELARREEEGLRSYGRVNLRHVATTQFDLQGVALEELLAAAQEALNALAAPPVEEVIAPIRVTIADQIARIEERLVRRGRVAFRDVLSEQATRVEVIVTLLALLELLKQDQVRVWQEELFGPVFIERREVEPIADSQAAPA